MSIQLFCDGCVTRMERVTLRVQLQRPQAKDFSDLWGRTQEYCARCGASIETALTDVLGRKP